MKKIFLFFSGILILGICTGMVSCDKKEPTQLSQDCPLSCSRGDINYNTIPYEVADLILLAHYFVEGLSVFSPNSVVRDYQICTTDVNQDCQVLTLSDLVYLVRIILHNAVEIKDTSPSPELVFIVVRNKIVTVYCSNPIGALYLELDSPVTPTLLATNMEMMSKDNKILVWSIVGSCIQKRSEVINLDGMARLTKIELVDCDSRELKNFIVINL